MSRVSYGSRAGDATDYGGGGHAQFVGPRHAARAGPYDSIDALVEALQHEFDAAAESALPVCTTIELSLGLNAVIPLVRPSIGPYADGGDHDLPYEFKNGLYEIEEDPDQKHPRAPCSAIINVADPKEKQIVQRAASRGVIAAIEALDGFRYSFNNAWTAKDEEGARFSFICQDSMQNKDRHANGYTRILKHLKDPTGGERGPRKPTYDCKGSVSVKFSSSRQSCDVYYRHNAIHDTVAARKPAARAAGGVKRTSSSWIKLPNANAAAPFVPQGEEDTGGLSAMLKAETASSALALVDRPTAHQRPQSSNISRPLKRKREDFARPAPPARQSNQNLSLADLLRQSETAKAPPPSNGNVRVAPGTAAVAYELPSWQEPPPAPRQTADGLPYPLPYQPKGKKVLVPASTPAAVPKNPPHPKNFQQFRVNSTPAKQQSSNQGGMFTTMKMVPTDKPPLRWPAEYQTPMNPPSATQFVAQSKPRSVLACTNCRVAKRRCDEGRPHCGACSKTGRTDCRYEAPAGWQKASTSANQQQTQSQNSTPVQSTPTSAQAPAQPMLDTARTNTQTPAQSSWSQTSPSGHQSWSGAAPIQQTPQGNWDAGQSGWPQDSTSQNTFTQGTSSAQSWPSQNSPPLQAWGNITMASPSTVRPQSPDPWYPKR